MDQYAAGATDQAATYKLDTAAALRSQVNAQLQGIMPLSMEYDGLGKDIAGQYGFASQADIGRFSSISASLQAYNDGDLSPMQYQMSASLTNQLQNYQTGAASGFLRNAGAAGVDQMQAIGAVSGLITTMSPQQAQVQESFNNMDWKGMSWAANKAGTSKYAMFDASGREAIQHSGNAAFGFMKNWQQYAPSDIDFSSSQTFAETMTGSTDPEIVQAFQDSGMFGLQRLSAQKSFDASMASAGVSFAGIALQEKFNWGSGTWNNPDANSMWGMQDKQRAMSYKANKPTSPRNNGKCSTVTSMVSHKKDFNLHGCRLAMLTPTGRNPSITTRNYNNAVGHNRIGAIRIKPVHSTGLIRWMISMRISVLPKAANAAN